MSTYQAGDRVRALRRVEPDGKSMSSEPREITLKRIVGVVGNLTGPSDEATVYSYDSDERQEWLVLGRDIIGKCDLKPVTVSAVPGQTVIINVTGREPIRVEVKP